MMAEYTSGPPVVASCAFKVSSIICCLVFISGGCSQLERTVPATATATVLIRVRFGTAEVAGFASDQCRYEINAQFHSASCI